MSGIRAFFLACIITLSLAVVVRAEDLYIAQSAVGMDNGVNCANAHSAAWFNTSGNWGAGAGKISAGDTVHLCGTFTGSANSTMLTLQGSGTSGNRITILFETNAVLTAPYWSTTHGAIYGNGQSYFTIDGGTNGVIRNTANGTALTYRAESIGIDIEGSGNATVQNLTISNIYVRTALTSGSTGFDSTGISAGNGDNILISNNTVTNVKCGFGYSFTANHSNVEVSNNTFKGSDVGIIVATGTAGVTLTTVLIHDNDFAGDAHLWDSPGNEMHHNAIHMWAQASNAHINGTKIYNNYVHGTWGNDQAYYNSTGGTHITSMFYAEEIAGSVYLYNNLIVLTGGVLNHTCNGMIFCKESTGQTCHVYNNTFISDGNDVGFETATSSGGHTFKNNLLYNVGYALYTPGSNSYVTADYNLYYGVTNWGASFDNWASWRASGQDAHGINGSDPLLDSNWRLNSASPARGTGVNLTSLGITTLNSDKAGSARSSSVAWDIGAYEGQGGTITPPSGFRVLP